MGGPEATVRQLPVGRVLFVDERDVGLRATWHLDRGFANLSVWRGDRCQETFHLKVTDAARFIGFLAEGLGTLATGEASPAHAPVGAPGEPVLRLVRARAGAGVDDLRRRLAAWVAP